VAEDAKETIQQRGKPTVAYEIGGDLAGYDAWVLRRIVTVQAVGGEVARMSSRWRRFAERLLESPAKDRSALLGGFLWAMPDPDAAWRAIEDADPLGPPPPGPEADVPGLPVRMTPFSQIEEKAVEWLWEGRVPLGTASLWAGAPKRGKSFVSLTLAAAVSRGAPMPGGPIPAGPASVVLMSAEDDASRTIKPRLRAAGADLSRIQNLESILPNDGGETLPSLRHDLELIEAAADSLGDCRLIVIDPVTAYLGGVDDHRNGELRGVLLRLMKAAERLGAAVVLLSHLSKSASTDAQQKVIGSVAYTAASRANFAFAKDRDDPTGRRVVMADLGGNLAERADTLGFVIADRGDGPRVEWLADPIHLTAEEALAAEQAALRDAVTSPERHEAEQWLKEVLARGPQPAAKLREAAKGAGIAKRTLDRAKTAVGVQSEKAGFGLESGWTWSLPTAPILTS
jgi:putative DNA primase/helicase